MDNMDTIARAFDCVHMLPSRVIAGIILHGAF